MKEDFATNTLEQAVEESFSRLRNKVTEILGPHDVAYTPFADRKKGLLRIEENTGDISDITVAVSMAVQDENENIHAKGLPIEVSTAYLPRTATDRGAIVITVLKAKHLMN